MCIRDRNNTMMKNYRFVLQASGMAFLFVLSTVVYPAIGKQTGIKEEEKYLIRCAIIDGGRDLKVVYKEMDKEQILELKDLIHNLIKEKGVSREALSIVYNRLREYGLIPEGINVSALVDKFFRRYENLSLYEFKKEIKREYPYLAPKFDIAVNELIASGVDPNTKISSLLWSRNGKGSDDEYGPYRFNVLCLLLYEGAGTLFFFPKLWFFGVLRSPIPICPAVIGFNLLMGDADTMGLLGREGGLTFFVLFPLFVGVVITLILPTGFPGLNGAVPILFTIAIGAAPFAGFWEPGYFPP